MKQLLLIPAFILCTISLMGQNKNNKFGITSGGFIQHYNGNLGNSFFKFNTTCFGGIGATVGMYLNKSFDLNVGASASHFGYCQTEADAQRIVSLDQRCPGCTDKLGMGELRSLMISGNVAVKYKFANDVFLKEDSKLSPYVYFGMGLNRLSDNMKKQCVNVGNHISVNSGVGIKYNITEKFNIGYNLSLSCFVAKKVYYTYATLNDNKDNDADVIKTERRKDLAMQNSIFVGFNF